MTSPLWPFPSVTDRAWLCPPGPPDPYLVAARDAVLRCAPPGGDRCEGDAEGDAVSGALTAARELADRLDWVMLSLVGEARGSGASWEQVGAALGVSKQAAHKRFSPYVALARAQAAAPADVPAPRRPQQPLAPQSSCDSGALHPVGRA